MVQHFTDEDFERYYLGMIPEGSELAALEEHLLICGDCVDRTEDIQEYIDGLRAAAITAGFDLKR